MAEKTSPIMYAVGIVLAVGAAVAVFQLRLGELFADLAAIPVPVYLSFKATQTTDPQDDIQWLCYWSVFGLLKLVDHVDGLLEWVPLYPFIKIGFVIWLWLPFTNGATTVYHMLIAPFFRKHEARIDAGFAKVEETAGKAIKGGIEKVQSEVRNRLSK
ncbi:TB2/DP1, HVA22 family-domain-containing protein [Hyaloraphidium curvatum]|nr:TB2/DP1, HVA22 family-domain-containing protein [Hyaloraphidium curvatum]